MRIETRREPVGRLAQELRRPEIPVASRDVQQRTKSAGLGAFVRRDELLGGTGEGPFLICKGADEFDGADPVLRFYASADATSAPGEG